MVNLQCSPELRMFLCSLYAPVCTEYGRTTLPCRRLCLRARRDCYQLMDMFGVAWPEEMDCSRSVNPGARCDEGSSPGEGTLGELTFWVRVPLSLRKAAVCS